VNPQQLAPFIYPSKNTSGVKAFLIKTPLGMVKMAEGSPPPSSSVPVTPGSRYEKSLGLLTTRFVALLQKAKDGVLDLKEVSLLTVFAFT